MSYIPSKVQADAEVVANTPSFNPVVSKDTKARYTTQASAYDRLLDNGPLTDRKIARDQQLGFFGGTGLVLPRVERPARRPATKWSLKKSLAKYDDI
jgi:hypothetical protein